MLLQLDLAVLSAFTLYWLAVVPTPGPNVLMVTHIAVTRRAPHVVFAILGNLTGIALLASLALVGWAAVLQTFPWLRMGVSVLGGLYLLWMGVNLMRRSRRAVVASAVPTLEEGDTPAHYRRTARLGLVTALSNAQAILFITSIFAATGVLNANVPTGFATIAIMMTCNASYLALLGWLFQRPQIRAGYARFRGKLDATIGLLFVLFGARLLWRAWVG